MKSSTLRVFLKVHTWVGLVAGLVLFIAFYAGAITVFTHQLQQWQRHDARAQPTQTMALGQPLIDAVLRAHPAAADGFRLVLPSAGEPRLMLEWHEPREPAEALLRRFAWSSTQTSPSWRSWCTCCTTRPACLARGGCTCWAWCACCMAWRCSAV